MCNELRGPSQRLGAWATHNYVAAVTLELLPRRMGVIYKIIRNYIENVFLNLILLLTWSALAINSLAEFRTSAS